MEVQRVLLLERRRRLVLGVLYSWMGIWEKASAAMLLRHFLQWKVCRAELPRYGLAFTPAQDRSTREFSNFLTFTKLHQPSDDGVATMGRHTNHSVIIIYSILCPLRYF
jgi:hypothetical protein